MLILPMSSKNRLCLSVLLVALVLSWGTCPCILARVLGIGTPAAEAASHDGVSAPVETPGACRCCKHHARKKLADAEPAGDRRPSSPDDCPCCSRGGAIRDLPPEGGDALQDVAPEVVALALVEPAPGVPSAPLRSAVEETATGPPADAGLHGCPVGIVLILS
jgi:hypothetical protein